MPEKWTGNLIGKMHNNRVTYDDLAKEMGCTKAYVSMILNGSRKPDGIRKKMEDSVAAIIAQRRGAD